MWSAQPTSLGTDRQPPGTARFGRGQQRKPPPHIPTPLVLPGIQGHPLWHLVLSRKPDHLLSSAQVLAPSLSCHPPGLRPRAQQTQAPAAGQALSSCSLLSMVHEVSGGRTTRRPGHVRLCRAWKGAVVSPGLGGGCSTE